MDAREAVIVLDLCDRVAKLDDIVLVIEAEHSLIDQAVSAHAGCPHDHRPIAALRQRTIGRREAPCGIAIWIGHVQGGRFVDDAVFEAQTFGFKGFKKLAHRTSQSWVGANLATDITTL